MIVMQTKWYARANNKYRNEKIKTEHGTFDSRLEYKEWLDLCLLQRAGKISHLKRQVRIKLGRSDRCKVHYITDFVYFDNEKSMWVIHDTKGYETPEFKLKLKWLLDSYTGFIFKVSKRNELKEYEPFGEGFLSIKEILK